jgi:hypothetical protein
MDFFGTKHDKIKRPKKEFSQVGCHVHDLSWPPQSLPRSYGDFIIQCQYSSLGVEAREENIKQLLTLMQAHLPNNGDNNKHILWKTQEPSGMQTSAFGTRMETCGKIGYKPSACMVHHFWSAVLPNWRYKCTRMEDILNFFPRVQWPLVHVS